jgi:hypothetical protein
VCAYTHRGADMVVVTERVVRRSNDCCWLRLIATATPKTTTNNRHGTFKLTVDQAQDFLMPRSLDPPIPLIATQAPMKHQNTVAHEGWVLKKRRKKMQGMSC